jgi:hypothetical protein
MDRDRIIMTSDGRERIILAETPLDREQAARQEEKDLTMEQAVEQHGAQQNNYAMLLDALKWVASATPEEIAKLQPDEQKRLKRLQDAVADIYNW